MATKSCGLFPTHSIKIYQDISRYIKIVSYKFLQYPLTSGFNMFLYLPSCLRHSTHQLTSYDSIVMAILIRRIRSFSFWASRANSRHLPSMTIPSNMRFLGASQVVSLPKVSVHQCHHKCTNWL